MKNLLEKIEQGGIKPGELIVIAAIEHHGGNNHDGNGDRLPNHVLKSWTGLFEPIFYGRKTHDLRVMDRDYKVGDLCLLREYDPVKKEYTGREAGVEITYITSSQHQECAVSPTALHPATGILSIRLIGRYDPNLRYGGTLDG